MLSSAGRLSPANTAGFVLARKVRRRLLVVGSLA
jgi:hypothetical protein